MPSYDLPARRARYFKLSSEIAHLDNTQLLSLFDTTEAQRGWGRNHIFDVGQSKVFVKLLPLTDLEHEHMFSTKNLYELPTYYNYGVGSAGFGVFRELLAHIKTTNWVLEGAIANFPLLYHYRIIPFSGERPEVDMEGHQGYVEYWNSNENIGRYILARANANYELALFLEHMPYAVQPWLLENLNKTGHVLEELRNAVTFLRKNGIVHFDANFSNVLSDGTQTYLTDFGLVLDRRFTLTLDEALLLKQSTYFDYGNILGNIGIVLYDIWNGLPDNDKRTLMEKYGIAEETHPVRQMSIVLKNIEEIVAEGIMKPDSNYVAVAIKYRDITAIFFDFFMSMSENKQKDTKFPYAKLTRLLKETGFVSGSI
jgi:hypothetical protein